MQGVVNQAGLSSIQRDALAWTTFEAERVLEDAKDSCGRWQASARSNVAFFGTQHARDVGHSHCGEIVTKDEESLVGGHTTSIVLGGALQQPFTL